MAGGLSALALIAARPPVPRPGPVRSAPLAAWLSLLGLAGALGGVGIGTLRLAAIDRGAFVGAVGAHIAVRGFVSAVPRRSDGEVTVRVQTAGGRLLVQAPEPVPNLPIGREVEAAGTVRAPTDWERGYLARYGISEVLAADRIELTGRSRGGIAALTDRVRDQAEAALGRGTPDPEAQLLRGFVLGEDDRIDPATVDDFKRSGLAHLLAVSGENVMLLAVLAAPLLGLLGVPLRARLVCVLGLIAIYVPVTGAAPSIMRAGVMGAAGVVAALAGRPRDRWHAVLLAAAVTLAVNPRTIGDPGWQLSFAAVIGILLWTPGLRAGLLSLLGGGRGPDTRLRLALAEGAAITIAATLATAPLFAHFFGVVSAASLPANLLALPAVAPMMWLGMLATMAGQVSWLPVEPLTHLAGLLAAYVAQVAHWLGGSGSQLRFSLPGWGAVAVAYVGLASGMWVLLRWSGRRRDLGSRPARFRLLAGRSRRALALAALAAAVAIAVVGLRVAAHGAQPARAPGLQVEVLDVGQGDAILLDPADGGPILVDGGPPGDGIEALLEDQGVHRLAGVVVTHYQSDHAGGIEDLLGRMPIHRLIYGEPAPPLMDEARAAGIPAVQVSDGSEVDSGSLRLEVLWPDQAAIDQVAAGEDPNRAAIVMLARWHDFDMLLTSDAEAELAPVDPGPVDVLKVAHHGSDDAGLDSLLDRALPSLAVISVGAHNPYGHPTAGTLATLSAHRVPVLRTDLDGTVTLDVDRAGWSATTSR